MKIFLDEFIIDRAAGSPAEQLSVMLLIKGIRMKCDITIFTPELLTKYYKKIKSYEKRFRPQPRAIKSFAAFLRDGNKARIMDQPPYVELPGKLDSDRELVAAAMACDSEKMLITTDGDLITFLQEASITTQCNIEAIRPETVMEKRGYTELSQ